MEWIIQEGLTPSEHAIRMASAVAAEGMPIIRAWLNEDKAIEIEREPEGPAFAYGSHGLSLHVAAKGWSPGTFLGLEGDNRDWIARYGSEMVNDRAVTCSFRDVSPEGMGRVFIRPAGINKLFGGMVLDEDEVDGWRRSLVLGRGSPVRASKLLGPESLVTYGPVAHILHEARFFIIDGKPIAWSSYATEGQADIERSVPGAMVDYASAMSKLWSPAPAFVLDIAETASGLRIVELNSINTSGLYKANEVSIVHAVEQLMLTQALPSP